MDLAHARLTGELPREASRITVRLSEDCRYRVAFARGVEVRAQGTSASAQARANNRFRRVSRNERK